MRILLAFVATLTASALLAQTSERPAEPSIVELANKERARRDAVESETEVITSEQLGYRSQLPAPPETSAADAPAAEDSEEVEKTPEEVRTEKRAEFQKKVDAEVQRMARVREVMAEAQRQLNDLTDLTFGTRRGNLQRLIEQGEADLVQSEETLARLQREARVAGVRVSVPR